MSIRSNPLFRDFSEHELTAIEAITQTLTLNNNKMLFKEGEISDGFYIIEKGEIRIFKAIEGAEKSLALLEAGATIGEMTLLEDDRRTASARAEGNVQILKVDKVGFNKLMKEYPTAAVHIYISFLKALSTRLKKSSQELVVLFEIGKLIGKGPDFSDLLKGVLNCVMRSLNTKTSSFILLNEISNKLEIVEAVGDRFDKILGIKTPPGAGLAGLAIKNNQTCKIDYLDADPEFRDVPRFGYETQSMVVVPLTRKGKAFGALLFCDKNDAFPFDAGDLNILQAVGLQAAAAIEAALQQKDRQAKEIHDRHYFNF